MEITAQGAWWALAGAIACFLAASALAILEVSKGMRYASLITRVLMGAGFVLETLYLHHQGQMRGRCPITSLPEILVFMSWSTVLIYFVIGPTYRLSLLGVFTAPLVALFAGLGLAGGAVTGIPTPPAGIVDPWLETHASVSLISYGAFALAFVAAVMFLIQDRLLKAKSLTPLFYNLPPVSYLANAVTRLLFVGMILLTVGIVTAFFIHVFPGWGKILVAFPVWLAYGILLVVNHRRKLAPQSLARATVVLFALPLITLTILGRR